MRLATLLTSGAVGAITLAAQADLFDNFDSYTSTADFNTLWTVNAGTGLALNTTTFYSGPNSVMNPGTAAQSNRRQMSGVMADALDFRFRFYDFDAGNARDYGMLYSRGGTGLWTDPLNNVLAIGKYNTIAGTRYYGRVSTASGAVYGDGASNPSSTWFQLGTGANDITPTVGWHTAEIIGSSSSAYSGKIMYRFYIDGVLGGSVDNLTDYTYNWAVLGSGLSTSPSGIAFDDLSITSVPEPSAAILSLLGGLLLLRSHTRRS